LSKCFEYLNSNCTEGTCFIGFTGSGKSTLIGSLIGLELESVGETKDDDDLKYAKINLKQE
jgi:predicted ABC-type transport system involved in lysophospholipase L1 biosynthesis ATPase subunit